MTLLSTIISLANYNGPWLDYVDMVCIGLLIFVWAASSIFLEKRRRHIIRFLEEQEQRGFPGMEERMQLIRGG